MEIENLQKEIDELLEQVGDLESMGKENTEVYLALMSSLKAKIENLKYYLENSKGDRK